MSSPSSGETQPVHDAWPHAADTGGTVAGRGHTMLQPGTSTTKAGGLSKPESVAIDVLPRQPTPMLMTFNEFREQDAQLWRADVEHEAELHQFERSCWERSTAALEDEVAARRRRLENASTLVGDGRQLRMEEQCRERSLLELKGSAALAGAREEVARWQAEAKRATDHVNQLEFSIGDELIRTERMRGSALAQRARWIDLEQQMQVRSAAARRLAGEVGSLEQHAALEKQEAAQKHHLCDLRQRSLERRLDEMRRISWNARADAHRKGHDTTIRQERELRQLRAQLQRKSNTLSAAAEAAAAAVPPCTETGSYSGSTTAGRHRRSSTPDLGPRVASVRAAQRRQQEMGRREINDLRAELFKEQHEIENASFQRESQQQELCWKLRQARSQLEVVAHTYNRAVTKQLEQVNELTDMEARLETKMEALELTHGKSALEAKAPCTWSQTLALGEPTAAHAASIVGRLPDVAFEVREAAFTARVRARKAMQELSEQHVSEVTLLDREAATQLQTELATARMTHQQELSCMNQRHHSHVARLRAELRAERTLPIPCPAVNLDLAGADCRLTENWDIKLQELRAAHNQNKAAELASYERRLRLTVDETNEVERMYLELRAALRAAAEEAKRTHEQVLEEQALQRQELVAALAGGTDLGDFAELLGAAPLGYQHEVGDMGLGELLDARRG